MKVYVVVNQALHHDSSYYKVIDVCRSWEEAVVSVGCEEYDFWRGIERGDFGDDFKDIDIDEDLNCFAGIVSKSGYYETWNIEEFEI